ncbi:hypothetical protein V3C99_004275, partial [Haemonchus contortus]
WTTDDGRKTQPPVFLTPTTTMTLCRISMFAFFRRIEVRKPKNTRKQREILKWRFESVGRKTDRGREGGRAERSW